MNLTGLVVILGVIVAGFLLRAMTKAEEPAPPADIREPE
jgi:hypothetical protein